MAELPLTEQQNPLSHHLDTQSVEEIVARMHQEDYRVLEAVDQARPQICQAIYQVVEAFRAGGRLFYVGAGTSGRLGVLDATECPPTYSVPPELVQGIIAGGLKALSQAVEGAEDHIENAEPDLEPFAISSRDVVIGIAASGTTPYVLEALRLANQRGAYTVLLACNLIEKPPYVRHCIILPVGPEIVSGSTRLKAGTATKLALNMISTVSMIQIGKVYDNLMVDLKVSNEKLRRRSKRIVSQLTGLSQNEAQALLERAQGEVKTAIVMHHRQMGYPEARTLLQFCQGHLRRAIEGSNQCTAAPG